jgi:hypothetical protein
MADLVIKKASKRAKKMRVGLSASSGFGKTYSSLLLAKGIVGDLSKVCVIDTERDSASLYADLGEYSVVNLSAPYEPERYIDAIKQLENSGFELIIIDSITHEWAGTGGCLEIHANLGGRFQDWKSVTPRHNAFISAILESKCHIITTVRRKQEYAIDNSSGRAKVEKQGMGEITRDGFEYELDINFEIVNDNHLAKASKDRTKLFDKKPEFIITEETGKQIKEWCNSGISPLDDALRSIRNSKTTNDLMNVYNEFKSLLGEEPDFKEALTKKKEEFIAVK